MKMIDLWKGVAPGQILGHEIPHLEFYPAEGDSVRGAVIICPGGAYVGRAKHEGEGYAKFLSSIGVHAFVLHYRVSPNRFPIPLLDARRAMRYVRANAETYRVNPEKIAIMGSSAGGHLAALLSTYNDAIDGEGVDVLDGVDYHPNAQILCYPVLDIMGHPGSFLNLLGEGYASHKRYTPSLLATTDTPPLSLWHTSSDTSVDVNNARRYAERLHELGISLEMHVYPIGGHGLGLADDELHNCEYVRGWADNLTAWLKLNKYMEK